MFCPNCGIRVNDNDLFCGGCGENLAPVRAGSNPPPGEESAPADAVLTKSTDGEPDMSHDGGEMSVQKDADIAFSDTPDIDHTLLPPIDGSDFQTPDSHPEDDVDFDANSREKDAFDISEESIVNSVSDLTLSPEDPAVPNIDEPSGINSGANPDETATEKKPVNFIPFVIGVGALAFIVLLFLAFRLFGAFGNPREKFLTSQFKALDNTFLMQNGVGDLSKGISTDATFTMEADGLSREERDILENLSFIIKVDINKNKSVLNYDLHMGDHSVFRFFLKRQKKDVLFSFPDVNKDRYKLNIETYLENNELYEDVDFDESSVQNVLDFRSILAKSGEKYFGILAKSMDKSNLKTKSKKSYTPEKLDKYADVSIKYQNVKITTWEPDRDELEEIILKIADALEKDKEFQQWINNMSFLYSMTVDSYLFSYGGYSGYESEDYAEVLRDNAKSVAKDLAGSGLFWETVSANNKVVSIRIGMDNYDLLLFEKGMDGKEQFEILCLDEMYALNSYKTVKNKLEGEFIFDTGYGSSLSMDYEDVNIKKKSALGIPHGNYILNIDGETVDMEVGDAKNGSLHKLESSGIVINIHTTNKSSAKEPTGKETDISDYDDEEMAEFFYDLGEEILDYLKEQEDLKDLIGEYQDFL